MWTQFDPDDMLNALSQPERDLFGEGSLEENQPDRLQRILDWVVSLVRGKVAAWPQNRARMGDGDTIPEELYGDAVEIARYKFLTSFPGGKAFLDESRTALYKDAVKHVDDAAAGKLVIEPPASMSFDPNMSQFGSRDNCIGDFGFWY
jgi:hypothetical protein